MTDDVARVHHVVHAVVVARDGQRWLPAHLRALAGQTRMPDVVTCVDISSTDDTHDMLVAAVGDDNVARAPAGAGFGVAVGVALTAAADREFPAGATEWLWLLHDDTVPALDALAELLTVADDYPSAGVITPKVQDWADPPNLVCVGVGADLSGHRVTDIRPGEPDQGQRDVLRPVLAGPTAGLLVRRDVWEQLGGLRPGFGGVSDDVDFGWRAAAAGHRVYTAPRAVVRHGEATAVGMRTGSGSERERFVARRRGDALVVLANCTLLQLPVALVLVALMSVLRSLGALLLSRSPSRARDELTGLGVTVRLGRWMSLRRHGAARGGRPTRHLLDGTGLHPWRRLDAAAERASVALATSSDDDAGPAALSADVAAFVDDLDDVDVSLAGDQGVLRRVAALPAVTLALVLTAIALIGERMLIGQGQLTGGRLLPAVGGASALLADYRAAYHAVGLGSIGPSSPAEGVIGVLAAVLVGKVSLAVDLLLLGAIPLAGVIAYVAAGVLTRRRAVRWWAGIAYALSPPMVAAVVQGRLDVTVALILLPVVFTGLRATLAGHTRAAIATAVSLAVAASFSPQVYVVTLVIAVIAVIWRRPHGVRRWPGLLAVIVGPLVLLGPYALWLVGHPGVLIGGWGAPLATSAPTVADTLALRPPGPSVGWWWLGLPLVVASLIGVRRGRRGTLAPVGWSVAALGFAGAVIVPHVVAAGAVGAPLPGWPGLLLGVCVIGLIVSLVVSVDAAPRWLGRTSFGWRQPVVLVLAAGVVLAPASIAVTYMGRGAGELLHRTSTAVLPVYAQLSLSGATSPTALVVREDPPGLASWSVLTGSGVSLLDGLHPPAAGATLEVTDALHALLSANGSRAVTLSSVGIRYLVAPAPAAPTLTKLIDGAGLVRSGSAAAAAVWALPGTAGFLQLSPTAATPGSALAAEGAQVLPAHAQRLLLVAAPRWGGFTATLDGTALQPRTVAGWQQAFTVPANVGGELIFTVHSPSWWWPAIQLAVVVLLLLLALPGVPLDRAQPAVTVPPEPAPLKEVL